MTLTDLAFTSHGIRSAAWHAPARLVGRAGRTALCRHGQRLRRNPRHNRGFGASEGSPRQDISVRRQRQDYHAAVAAVRHLSGVDRNRVVLWGTSYSGGHCVAVAAKDGRIAAVVSMPPAMDGFATVLHLMRQGEIGLLLRATANGWRDLAHESPLSGIGCIAAIRRRSERRAPYHDRPASQVDTCCSGAILMRETSHAASTNHIAAMTNAAT
jgi:acetyl xylan esterase AXE1